MTPDPLAEASAPAPLPPEMALLAAFEQRVLTRDEPRPRVLAFDAASVQARLAPALRAKLGQREPRRLRRLAVICYSFLATPTQRSTDPDLLEALSLSQSGLNRAWRELRDAGLVEGQAAGPQRHYRLTRAGEDWLLAVVKGETPPA
jgi:DNA-binding transcriptional ArsR family regulator